MTRARFFLLGLLPGLLLSLPGTALGQQCVEDVLCIITEERDDAVHFYVDNRLPDPLIVVFDVEAENMTGSVRFPHVGTYAGNRQSSAFSLQPRDQRARWRFQYVFRWRPMVNTLGCQEDLFCIVTEEHDPYVEIYVDNKQPFEVTIKLDVSLDNAQAEEQVPYMATYPGNRRTRAFRFKRIDPVAAIRHRYSYQWLFGSLHARHDDAFAYALPYAQGKSFTVVQGYDGAFSHEGKHAIDWEMPERTPVHAARGGVVVAVEVGYTEGGLADRLKTRANHILIRHDDGTLGNYVHLAPNGAFVTVGQSVRQGQAIGVSGNTGYSSGPHLHFEVYTVTEALEQETIPIGFRIEGARWVVLQKGRAYTAPLQ